MNVTVFAKWTGTVLLCTCSRHTDGRWAGSVQRSVPSCAPSPLNTRWRCARRQKRLRLARAWPKCAPCTCHLSRTSTELNLAVRSANDA